MIYQKKNLFIFLVTVFFFCQIERFAFHTKKKESLFLSFFWFHLFFFNNQKKKSSSLIWFLNKYLSFNKIVFFFKVWATNKRNGKKKCRQKNFKQKMRVQTCYDKKNAEWNKKMVMMTKWWKNEFSRFFLKKKTEVFKKREGPKKKNWKKNL